MANERHSRGSEWQKWDLHVHSPMSALNAQFPRLGNGEPDWEAYIGALESVQDIGALAITDYFTIEGYRRVRDFRDKDGRARNVTLLLPNIEFRLNRIIKTGTGPRRLNYHVIFSDTVSPHDIEEHFLYELRFCFEGEPQNADRTWSVRRTNLEMLGRRLKGQHAKFNDRSDFEIGCMNATVDPAQIKEVLRNNEAMFKGKYLLVLEEEYVPLMDWDGQDHLTRKVLLQGADAIFSSNEKTAAWARGERDLSPDQFRSEFKSLKPCLHGSDTHCIERIGRPDGNRYCWIKAELTFEGLRQVLYEPAERVFVGEYPAVLKNDYQIIKSVEVSAAPGWFSPSELPLNRDLVAVIGPRGSGKSALVEAIAFAGGAELFREAKDISDTFLFKASRRSAANPTPIFGATIGLRWGDGSVETVRIPDTLRHGKPQEQEKVKYLPQRFVDRLCAPENTQQLEQEIERVIFQRIGSADRLDASNFQELRSMSTRALQLRRESVSNAITSLNQSIAHGQARLASRPAKEQEKKGKQAELDALLKNAPKVPEENKDELKRLEDLAKQKEELERELVRLSEQLTSLAQIQAKFEVLKESLRVFNEEIEELLEKVELATAKERFEVRVPADLADTLHKREEELTRRMGELRGRAPGRPGEMTLAGVGKEIEQIAAHSRMAEARRREYEKHQKERQQIERGIASLQREINEITNILLPRVKAEYESREEKYLDAFALLKEEQVILEGLYEPLRSALAVSNEVARKLTFVSRITFNITRHASGGMELLDRRRALYREQEELERALRLFFERAENSQFDREEIRNALRLLRTSFTSRNGTKMSLGDQLRRDKTLQDFTDWFYSIEDFAVTYSIKFDGKDLNLLSPGEKGIVLLLLYLEAETEDNRPLLIDQPDDNLDNVSVYPSLIEYFRTRKRTRQIIIITHNPNLVVNTDADQVFVANFDGTRTPKLTYRSGALEDTSPLAEPQGIREEVCRILEGGTEAFQKREQRYSLP
jgi:energy-coupling factor transporter ATP-binding protein EcfA2